MIWGCLWRTLTVCLWVSAACFWWLFKNQSQESKGNVQGLPTPVYEFRDSSIEPCLLEALLPDGADLSGASTTHGHSRSRECQDSQCLVFVVRYENQYKLWLETSAHLLPQPAHIGLAEHLCLWLRDRRLCKVVLQDLPRTHQWKLIAALLGWVWICCLHSLPFSPHTFFTHTVYSYKRKQNRKVPQRDVLELGEPHQGPQSVTVGSFRQHCAMVNHDSQLDRM